MQYHILCILKKITLAVAAFSLLSIYSSEKPGILPADKYLKSTPAKDSPNSYVKSTEIDAATRARMEESYGNLPMGFEANDGQLDEAVKFRSRGNGYTLHLTSTEAVLNLRYGSSEGREQTANRNPDPDKFGPFSHNMVRLQFLNSNPNPQIAGLDELPGKTNCLIGNDPSKWRTGISRYRQVKYSNVYPGIDVVYYGNQRQLEYDVVLSPGADPEKFRLRILGATEIRTSPKGDLILTLPGGEVIQKKPFIYQIQGKGRNQIQGRYVLRGENEVGFLMASYDPHKSLVIDPVLSYSSYLGGSAFDIAQAIAVDSGGNIYIAGETESDDLPITGSPPFQSALDGLTDAFVAKLNPAGTELIYCTYLGGSDFEDVKAVVVNSSGSAYVAGNTTSPDFPVTPGALETDGPPGYNVYVGFVSKLSSTGAALEYSTYIGSGTGSSSQTYIYGMAVDTAGCAYVAGRTGDAHLPTSANSFQPVRNDAYDAFVIKLNDQGSEALYGTYLGGGENDCANGIALDSSGNIHIAGYTLSTNFPMQNPIQASNPNTDTDGQSGFVATLNEDASELIYSTYLGGLSTTEANAIAVDSSGNAYVTGEIQVPSDGSEVFPLLNPLQDEHGGDTDAFLAKFTPAGTLAYSTYLGGLRDDVGLAIQVRAGSAYVAGRTLSFDFPAVNAFQPFLTGSDRPVYKSLDSGANWTSGSAGEGTGLITALAVNPSDPSILYAGSAVGSVYCSTDGGEHWNGSAAGLPEAKISSLSIAASNTSILYAGTKEGVYKSTDAGETWFSRVTTGLDDLTINAVAVDPTNADIVYAATGSGSWGAIYKSIDGGASWTVVAWSDQLYITCLVIHPTAPQRVYSGTSNGYIVYSYDGFASGPQVYNPSNDVSGINALTIDPAGEKLYIAVYTFLIAPLYPDLRLLTRTIDLQCVGSICAIYNYDGKGAGLSVAVTPSGNTYVGTPTTIVGAANTAGFNGPFRVLAADPLASDIVYMGNPGTNNDAFLSVVNPAGSSLLSSTFFGGSASDSGLALALGTGGKVFLAGFASSPDLYTTPGAYQGTKDGLTDAFVIEFQFFYKNDVIFNFGSGTGIWARYNDATWAKLHTLNPEATAIGDLDGNGQDDCVFDFGSGIGLYALYNNTTWAKLHSLSPEIIATGDLDGNGEDDCIIDFGPSTGLWIRYNNATWTKLHSLSPESISTGDLDGNGEDDCIVDFGASTGVYVYYNNATWAKLHSSSPETIAIGDLDGNGKDDCILDFGSGTGVWVRYNNTTWTKLHSLSPEIIATGDLDGNGQDDCIIDFGSGIGVYGYYNNSTWMKLHSLSPEIISTGDLDSNGQDDCIIDFGSGIGTYVLYNNTTWTKLHSLSPESINTGNMDNN